MQSKTEDKRAELLARLGTAVEELTTSPGWQTWLTTASRFRTYSVRNQLLIAAQRPDSTLVAGYRAWQALGRSVRKGERGIAILAPCIRKVQGTDEAGEQEQLVG